MEFVQEFFLEAGFDFGVDFGVVLEFALELVLGIGPGAGPGVGLRPPPSTSRPTMIAQPILPRHARQASAGNERQRTLLLARNILFQKFPSQPKPTGSGQVVVFN